MITTFAKVGDDNRISGRIVPMQTLLFRGYVSLAEPQNANEAEIWYESAEYNTSFPWQVRRMTDGIWSDLRDYTPIPWDLISFDGKEYYWNEQWKAIQGDGGGVTQNYVDTQDVATLASAKDFTYSRADIEGKLEPKANIYDYAVPTITKSFSELKIGDDLTGTSYFWMNPSINLSTEIPGLRIEFNNNSRSYLTVSAGGRNCFILYYINNSNVQQSKYMSLVDEETVDKFPDISDLQTGENLIITSINWGDNPSSTVFTDSSVALGFVVELTDESGLKDVSNVYDEFVAHKAGDLRRWNEMKQLRQDFYDLRASIEQKHVDTENSVDIESQTQSATGYTVTDTLGGRIDFTGLTVLFIPARVFVNGTEVWSSSGLIGGGSDVRDVKNGDVITTSSITSITYAPYVPNA